MHGRLSIVCLVILFFSNGSAWAQDLLELPTVTVTAQKQEQDLQKTPASVTTLSETELEDRGIDSISDVADFTPNFVNVSSGIVGLYIPSIRGISQDGSGGTPVGLFIDGVPVLSATGFNDELMDIERVEVLRGPQGTLYGSGTEAGAINVITRKPGNEFMGKASATAGEDDRYKLAMSLSGPVVIDNLYFSLSALHNEKGGFIKNTNTGNLVNNRNYNYAKAGLRWTPTEHLEVSLIASGFKHDDGDQSLTLGPIGALIYGVDEPKKRQVQSDLEGWNKSSSGMMALKVNWDINDAFQLQSVTSARKYRSHYLNDWDFTSLVSAFSPMHSEMDSTLRNYSQELKLTWSGAKDKVITGIYVDKDNNDFTQIDFTQKVVSEKHTTTGQSLGLFAHYEKKITQKFSMLAGIRYDLADGEFDDKIRLRKNKENWSEISPKIVFQYEFTNNIMAYAGVSKGYRKGGFNDHADASDPVSYDEETLISYEVGAKTEFFDKRLRLNAAAYYMDIDDMQVRIDNPQNPEFNYVANAAKAYSAGFEAEVTARVMPGLTLSGSFGCNRTVFQDYSDSNGNYDGNKNPYAPNYTYSINAHYRSQSGIFANASLVGTGSMYLDKENTYERNAYSLVNFKTGYETQHLDLYLYAKNLFDKEYNSIGYFGGVYNIYSPPREIGVVLTYRF